ncbi:cyclin-H1-1 isoform X4 [Spinacia oleracea]|uniref:Cyclin-H1-1 isoform X3 n=1 Tax=Spinacia oleracea TaxID=3562 RepID=A0ABM3RWG8_SPIOL|nr:cyclin-H1-1 isoform X3 [Spinacia oleracea]XP_056699922.1 cyclin-H1-1 isoform X4 [Spinacia oleracea]XP_056699923.1 cyclin-H1-1 isoform X4 [Spinacia oleracea]
MADFHTSTQRAKWIFTEQELNEKYKAANQRAIQSLEKYGTTSLAIDADGSFSHPKSQKDTEGNGIKQSRVKPLKVEEEKVLHVYYENKIQEVCGAFKFPHKIQATALTYYKRFYLCWSVMEHHPKSVMLTCIYLACKIEENHVSAEELGKGIQQDHRMILDNEMLVLQSLGFDLIVYTPYRSIEGFINDMEDFCYATSGEIDMLPELHQRAVFEADKAVLTDAPLLFPPGQLALAVLRRANSELLVLDFERYLQSILSRQQSEHTISELDQGLNAIEFLIKRIKMSDNEEMKRVAKKLKSCQDSGSRDDKKRDKKSKHKSKRNPQEIQTPQSAAAE